MRKLIFALLCFTLPVHAAPYTLVLEKGHPLWIDFPGKKSSVRLEPTESVCALSVVTYAHGNKSIEAVGVTSLTLTNGQKIKIGNYPTDTQLIEIGCVGTELRVMSPFAPL